MEEMLGYLTRSAALGSAIDVEGKIEAPGPPTSAAERHNVDGPMDMLRFLPKQSHRGIRHDGTRRCPAELALAAREPLKVRQALFGCTD